MKTIIIVLISIIVALLFIALVVALTKSVLKKVMFHISNDDKGYLMRFEEHKEEIMPVGNLLLCNERRSLGEGNTVWQIEQQNGTVTCRCDEKMIYLDAAEQKAIEALCEVFGEAVFDRIVFQEGRISFYAKTCWKGCTYVPSGKRPTYFEHQKEVFQFRVKRISREWYMMLA